MRSLVGVLSERACALVSSVSPRVVHAPIVRILVARVLARASSAWQRGVVVPIVSVPRVRAPLVLALCAAPHALAFTVAIAPASTEPASAYAECPIANNSRASASDERASTDDRAALDKAAVEAYRRGDLDSARSLWLSMLGAADARASDAMQTSGAASDPAADRAASASTATTPALPALERARVLYDLGNVAYRKKKILEAVGWYTAALRLSPRDADAWWNLEHARSEAKLEPADRGDLSGTLRRLVSSLTVAESEWLVIGVLAAWSAVLAIEALRGGRVWRRLALGGAIVLAASLGPWLFHLKHAGEHPLLAIQDGKLEVRSEPRADAPAIAELAAGDEAEAIDALPEWTKVELANGVQGWARKSGLFALDR